MSATGPRCRRCGEPPGEGPGTGPCARCGTPPGAADPTPGRLPAPAAALLVPFRGAAFVARNPGLVLWVVLPLLVDLLVFAGLVALAVSLVDSASPAFADPWWGWIDWLRGVVAWSTRNLLRVVAVAAAFFATLGVAGAVNAPFHDLLSEKTEDRALAVRDPGRPWSRLLGDVLRATRAALLLLAVQAAVMVPLFVLSFTAVGAPLFAAAGAWFAGMGLADIPLGRKRYGGRERLRWALRRWPLVVGLGVPLTLLPPLQPLAVVGATLLYLEQPEKDPAPAPPVTG